MISTSEGNSISHFVGIDVSKEWLDCYLLPGKQYLQCENNTDGFEQLDQWLRAHGASTSETVICMENNGMYDDRLLQALDHHQWQCAVEKTTVLEKVTPDHHRKDDRYDAMLLAEYASRFTDKLHIWKPKGEQIERLRQLYSERRRLVVQKAAVQSKFSQSDQLTVVSETVQACWDEQLGVYQQLIDTLEQHMHQIVSGHAGLHRYWELLISIPGVGNVTAWLWLIKFYGQQKLNSKKIASRFGFAPHSKRSGSSVRGKTRSSGHGTAQMRQCMGLAARAASTHYKQFRSYKERKLEEGKLWPVIRNNLVNKLIKIICAIWNSGLEYQPGYVSRFDRQKAGNRT
jgi:transposase